MVSRRQRVFVVDDEKIIATTLAAILTLQGYDVQTFTDPLLALQAFEQECPDLLLSDVMMPGITGVNLAIRVKALCPRCRILLISGQAATDDLLGNAREKGYDFELFEKPFEPVLLLRVIEQRLQPTAD